MSIFIQNDGRGEAVARAFFTVCKDPNLAIDVGVRSTTSPDGSRITARGSGRVAFRTTPNPNDPALPNGVKIVAALVALEVPIVVVRGLGSNDLDMARRPIIESGGGVTSPVIVRKGVPHVFIDLDVEG